MPVIRAATLGDLGRLEQIENDADRAFIERFHPASWAPAGGGRERAARAGFVLVVADSIGGAPLGFAHVLDLRGDAHLDQLAVRTEAGRRGLGSALVAAVLAEAARRGFDRVTLRTYADVPWNAPFYARLGFVESEPDTDVLRALADEEADAGLEDHGRRIQMTAPAPIVRA